jgi:hypothetical protein
MGNPVYAIDEFPDDDLPWRIEWIGGVGYNTSVPSEPRSMFAWRSSLLGRRTHSARDRVPLKRKERSDRCWPATLHLNCFSVAEAPAGSNGSRCLPPSSAHRYYVVSHGALGELTSSHNAIPRSNYLFSVPPGHMCAEPSWSPDKRRLGPAPGRQRFQRVLASRSLRVTRYFS